MLASLAAGLNVDLGDPCAPLAQALRAAGKCPPRRCELADHAPANPKSGIGAAGVSVAVKWRSTAGAWTIRIGGSALRTSATRAPMAAT